MKNPFSQENTQSYRVKQQVIKINHQKKCLQKQSPLFYHSKQSHLKNKYRKASLHQKQTQHIKIKRQLKQNYLVNHNQEYGLTTTYQSYLNNSRQLSASRSSSNLVLSNKNNKNTQSISSILNFNSKLTQNNSNNYQINKYMINHNNFKLSDSSKYLISSQTKDSFLGEILLSNQRKRQKIQYQSIKAYGAQTAFRYQYNLKSNNNLYFSSYNPPYDQYINKPDHNFNQSNTDIRSSSYSQGTALFGVSSNSFGKSNQKKNHYQTEEYEETQNDYQSSEIQRKPKKSFAHLRSTLQMYKNKKYNQKLSNYTNTNTQTEDDFFYANEDQVISSDHSQKKRSSSKLVTQLIGIDSQKHLNASSYRSDFYISQDAYPASSKIQKKKINRNEKKKISIFCTPKPSTYQFGQQQDKEDEIDAIVERQDLQRSNQRKPSLKKDKVSQKLLATNEESTSGKQVSCSSSSLKSKSKNKKMFKAFQEDQN